MKRMLFTTQENRWHVHADALDSRFATTSRTRLAMYYWLYRYNYNSTGTCSLDLVWGYHGMITCREM